MGIMEQLGFGVYWINGLGHHVVDDFGNFVPSNQFQADVARRNYGE